MSQKKVKYNNIYGVLSEAIQYRQLFSNSSFNVVANDFGVNTELTITKNLFKSYSYNIEIENIKIDRTCPDYILFRHAKDGTVKAIIYNPLVVDKKEDIVSAVESSKYDIDVETINHSLYKITYSFNDDYMRTASYPIKINQSFHLYKPKQPDSAIYSRSSKGFYLNDHVVLGNNKKKGEGRLLIRFEVLDLINLNPDDVISAEYIASEISGGDEEAKIAMIPIKSDWCSINTRWRSMPKSAQDNIREITVSKSGSYSFDLTEPLKLWLKNKGTENEYIIRNGFSLVNLTPETPKIFATSDNGLFTTCLKIKVRKIES